MNSPENLIAEYMLRNPDSQPSDALVRCKIPAEFIALLENLPERKKGNKKRATISSFPDAQTLL